MSGSDLRLVPVAVTLWLALLVVTVDRAWLTGMLLLPVAVLIVLSRVLRRWMLLAWALALVAAITVGGLRQHSLAASPVARLAADQAIVEISLKTTGDPRPFHPSGPGRSTGVQVPARTLTVSGRGQDWSVHVPVSVMVSGAGTDSWLPLPAGTTVEATARLVPADQRTGAAAVVRIRGPAARVAEPSPGWRLTNRVREGLRTAVAHQPADQRALVPALVVGDTSAMPEAMTGDFRASGLTHLSAVSGANLALMLAFILTAARWIGVRGWWLRLLGLAGVVAFVAICRTEPSVLRAAAMGLVAMAGLGAGAGGTSGLHRGFRTLAVAVIVLLLVDPWLCRSAGFALSTLATAGIVAWAGTWSRVLSRWLPRWLAEAAAVPLAAQLATQPVITSISGQLSLVGIVANALAGPCVGPATVLGFAAAGTSLVSRPLASVLGFGAGWVSQLIIWVGHYGASLPGAVMAMPSQPPVVVLIAAGCVVLAWLMPHLLVHWWLVGAVILLMVVVLLRAPGQPGWPPQGWFMVACDVGQGDGLVVKVGSGQAVVIDTGPEPAPIDTCLRQLGIRTVPLLILSHFHADHVGGLAGLLRGRTVGTVLISPLPSPPAEAVRVRSELTSLPAGSWPARSVRVAALGESLTEGPMTWLTLGPVHPAPEPLPANGGAENAESPVGNDASIVGMMTLRLSPTRTVRILFPGDAEPDAQQDVLDSGADLHADILKVPHHGSSRQDVDFLRATGARIAITSSGLHNPYGHPAPSTVRRLELFGMTVVRTDTEGAVAVWFRGDRVGANTQR